MPHDGGVGFAVGDGLAGFGVLCVVRCGDGCIVGVFGEGGVPSEIGESGNPFGAPVVGTG